MPAITAVSTADAVIMEGYMPVLVDVDPISWMLSLNAVTLAITEKTAAIITVAWLGTLCDLRPFRKLADKHGIKLISDSAQSFGTTHDKPSAVDLADATIYSTGFPKVFQTGGSGGIVICSTSQAEWLKQDPSGILRHEMMPEINAYSGLRALDHLLQDLEARTKAAETYRSLLCNIPGIVFPDLAPGLGTNHYQLSATVDAKSFGLDAKGLCWALQVENILCSRDRMQCLSTINRILQHCKVPGKLSVSQALEEDSLTFPIFNQLTSELCQTICSCMKAIHRQSHNITLIESPVTAPSQQRKQASFTDIAEKFPDYWVVPIIDEEGFVSGVDGNTPWIVLVQWKHLVDSKISIDEVQRRVLSRRKWSQGETVTDKLNLHAKFEKKVLVLSSYNETQTQVTNEPFYLTESGSSARVTLELGPNGVAEVHKTCSHEGIDGNGSPWLKRQVQFYESSVAVRETDIFVKPIRYRIAKDTVSMNFPYVPSHSLAEMALAGMGADSLLIVLGDVISEMAACVWPKSAVPCPDDYIEQAHFKRMRRRVGIACDVVPELNEIVSYQSITMNGKQLLGFHPILDALSHHPKLKEIAPRRLGEIHGDLNLHNVLGRLDPNTERLVVLIDPRGVPLLQDFSSKTFEPGDYSYDISKLKFSLSGFSEIRKGMYDLQHKDNSFKLIIKDHPGSDTLRGADRGLVTRLSSNGRLMKWIEEIEPCGLCSLDLRVMLGEAAHYIADSACALGRDRVREVLPLFLLGIVKLNDLLEKLDGKDNSSIDMPKRSIEDGAAAKSPNYGTAKIQSALLGLCEANWTWNVLEVLVKSESTNIAYRLLSDLIGECLPEETDMYISTHAVEKVKFPCVLIHPFVGVRGQTHAVLSSVRRTDTFLRDGEVPQGTTDSLRVVTITSTGASTRSQYVSRQNDKLLSPGPWGISPLRLIVLQANQLSFPCAGRWIVENDSFFVLGQSVNVRGDCIGLVTSKRRTTGSNSSWRVRIDSTDKSDGRTFATSFRQIETPLLRPTSAISIPNDLREALATIGGDYTTRSSPFLVDFVLPHFMQREEWIELCHSQGFGCNSDLAWNNAQRIANLFPQVELVDGGDKMVFRHFGSDSEYTKLVDGIGNDQLLASLAHLPSTAKWLRHYVASRPKVTNSAMPIF